MFVTGDLHGNHNDLLLRLELYNEYNENHSDTHDTVFVCGDAGLEYGDHIHGQMKKTIQSSGYTFIILRGNHDNRYCADHLGQEGWHTEEWCGTTVTVQDKYPNIKYLSDAGGTFTYNGKKCLYIPGAYSVDKFYRIMRGWSWREDEQLTFEEMNVIGQLAEMEKFDAVFSHTAPKVWEEWFDYLFIQGIDQSNIDKHTESFLNQVMLNIMRNGGNCDWYFGHFHGDIDHECDGNIHAHMLYKDFRII